MYEIIIIGGGHAGLAAALAAQRAGVEKLLLLEKNTGISFPDSLPVRLGTRARRLTTAKVITVEDTGASRYLLKAHAIILATGALRLSKNERPIPDRTLTDGAHLLLDPTTGGPVVDQSRQSEIEGIFVCGNALHFHDSAQTATQEGAIAGKAAAEYILGKKRPQKHLRLHADHGVSYAVPQCITAVTPVTLHIRPAITCPHARILIRDGAQTMVEYRDAALSPERLLSLPLTASALRQVTGDTLTVTVEPIS